MTYKLHSRSEMRRCCNAPGEPKGVSARTVRELTLSGSPTDKLIRAA